MGVINISDERNPWIVARWAFRGYLDHVLAEVLEDPALAYVIEEAIALDGLHLQLTNAALLPRLGAVLSRVADEIVRGTRPVRVEGRVLDDKSQEQFRDAVAELRMSLVQRWPLEGPG